MNDSTKDGRFDAGSMVRAAPTEKMVAMKRDQFDDDINLRELFDLLWSGRWIVASVTVIFAIVGLCYSLVAPPVYTATGLVQVEEDQNVSASLDQLSSLLEGGGVQAPAEIALIKSRMVLEDVAEKLKLRTIVVPNSFPLIGAAYLRRQNGVEGLSEAPFGMSQFGWGGERATITTFKVPEELQDLNFTLVVGDKGYSLMDPDGKLVLSGLPGKLVDGKSVKGGAIQIFVQELVARPGMRFSIMQQSRQATYKHLTDMLNVSEQTKDSGIIQITYKDASPELAAKVVTGIENAYLKQNVERRSEEAQQSLSFVTKQLPSIKSKVDEAQAKLNAYQAREGTADIQKETELALNQAVALEGSRLSLVQQRELALQRFTSRHPEVMALDEQIATIDKALAKIRAQVESMPSKQQEIFSLMRDLDVNSQLYVTLLNSSQQLQVAKAGTVGDVRIIDDALTPRVPSSPNKPLIVFASVLLGALTGIFLIFLQRVFLRGVDRPEEIERELGLPSYASIPFSSLQKKLSREFRRGRFGNGILASVSGGDHSIEALRSLRTSLHFAMLEATNNVVMLTGPIPALGKSFIAINLGAVLAMGGKRVVVVDADLRRGRLNAYVSERSHSGISDYVLGSVPEVSDVVNSTPIDGLDLVFNGTTPPNPAEVLMHRRFADLIGELSKRYDFVIIDTPPVLSVADASIVGRLAGTTFVVLKAAEHPMRAVEETIRRLSNAGVAVKGVILNQVGARVGSHGYGQYGHYYGYSSYGYDSEK